jgi:hypothetical protein
MVSKTKTANVMLADVPVEFVFYCNNGNILHNMNELASELRSMSDETYSYHANMEKNDFVNWVRDIIKDETLAINLQKTSNRYQAARAAADRVNAHTRRKA